VKTYCQLRKPALLFPVCTTGIEQNKMHEKLTVKVSKHKLAVIMAVINIHNPDERNYTSKVVPGLLVL
jgi:hypothetical protein